MSPSFGEPGSAERERSVTRAREEKGSVPAVPGPGEIVGEEHAGQDRRRGSDRRLVQAQGDAEERLDEGARFGSRPPPVMLPFPDSPDTAARASLAVAAYPEGSPCAPRLRQLARLELPEPEAQLHWRAIARHRENLLQKVGRDVGLRVAILDYFLNIRPQLWDLAIIESGALAVIECSAILDSLTGVFNREYFYEVWHREVERCRRHKMVSSLLMLDVDDLKGVNDRYGHAAGDRALHQLGELISKHLRAVDVPCRYGGDEFAVVLPDTGREEAFAVGERIRCGVGSFFQQYSVGGHSYALTVSGGVATCLAGFPAAESVIAMADRLLYAAKREGRNRIALTLEGDRGIG
jgi:diguanylate cyclase (GGDEF)-like protein